MSHIEDVYRGSKLGRSSRTHIEAHPERTSRTFIKYAYRGRTSSSKIDFSPRILKSKSHIKFSHRRHIEDAYWVLTLRTHIEGARWGHIKYTLYRTHFLGRALRTHQVHTIQDTLLRTHVEDTTSTHRTHYTGHAIENTLWKHSKMIHIHTAQLNYIVIFRLNFTWQSCTTRLGWDW